jgi:hypothetical protein
MGDGGNRQATHLLPPEFSERERNVQDFNTIIPKDPEQSLWNHPCFNTEDHSSRMILKNTIKWLKRKCVSKFTGSPPPWKQFYHWVPPWLNGILTAPMIYHLKS